ncbi:uncharacterized protein TNCV_4112201 [Trichonephila clavipes]|nr:uncharacterized protein TNCV_4112201 [Trichonephila clavipes]
MMTMSAKSIENTRRGLPSGTGEYFPPLQFTCRNCGGGDRGRVAIYRPFGEVSLSLNRTVTCMVLKANDRRTSCPCHDEFRGPRSDYVRQDLIEKCKNYKFFSSVCTSMKVNKMHNINLSFVFGLRTIGKGHSAVRKLCSAINVNFPSKTAFMGLKKKLEHVSNNVACKIMNEAATEVHKKNNFDEGVQSMEPGNVEDTCL